MITLTREEAQQVLDALEEAQSYTSCETWSPSMTEELRKQEKTLRAKIAQPEPKPSAWAVQEGVNLHDVFLFEDEADEMCHLKGDHAKAIPLYTARLAQPEPEPVADKYLMEIECTKCGAKQDGILTVNVPPQREWQGLTDDDFGMFTDEFIEGALWTEAKLKEKNE